MAIWVITVILSASGEGLAVLVGRNTHAAKEIAPHGFRGAEAAPAGDRDDGVVGLLQLPARGFGADALDVLAGRLADLIGEHPREMARAHRGAAGQVADGVLPARCGLDGLLHLAHGATSGPRHPHRRRELRLPARATQIQDEPAGDRLRDLGAVVVLYQGQGEVDARGDTRGSPYRVRAADEDRIGIDVDEI